MRKIKAVLQQFFVITLPLLLAYLGTDAMCLFCQFNADIIASTQTTDS